MMQTLGILAGPLAALLAVASVGIAAVLRVPSEYPTIQQAIDAAVSGDSVLVAPGVYTNCDGVPCTANVALMKSGVALVSEAGPELTILRVDTPAGGVSMVRGAGAAGVLLKGFTMTGTASSYRGAAFVSCQGIDVEDCHFVDLAGGLQDGAGLFANGSTIEVRGCKFRRCEAVLVAGGYSGVNSSSIVEDCFFEECEPGAAHVAGLNSSSAAVRDCVFRNNMGNVALAVLEMTQAEICGNVFEGNTSAIGGAAALSVSSTTAYATVEGNLFVGNTAVIQTSIVFWSASGEVRANTFFGNTAPLNRGIFAHWSLPDRPTAAANNIFSGNMGGPAYRAVVSLPQASCNLFWANSGGDYEGYVPSPTDLFVDPLFCNPEGGDFRLMSDSPCLPKNSGTCGLIGAFGEGCGTVSVAPSSWGSIKNRFR